MINSLLSIVIPTFNRAAYLDRCLAQCVLVAERHSIGIHVSDNASTDDTQAIVEKHRADYPNIFYGRNDSNIGADLNFEVALARSESEFVWLLGDTYKLTNECVDHALRLIEEGAGTTDAYVFNVEDRVSEIASKKYTDHDLLLSELGWHMTCMSSLVYNRRLLADARFKRYRGTNFIQTGIIFEFIFDKQFLVSWVQDVSVRSLVTKDLTKTGWHGRTIDVWANKWAQYVLSLPTAYLLSSKLKCIRDHGTKSRIFSLNSMIELKIKGLLTTQVVHQNELPLRLATRWPTFLLTCITLVPNSVLSAVLRFRKHSPMLD